MAEILWGKRGMTERIQKILAERGIASRRHAEELIKAGRVTCNGHICQIGQQADPEQDTILLDGKPIPSREKAVYILLNKPRGYVTTASDEKGRKNVTQLVADCGVRVYPIGRLDMDSEGLLLLTNDGDFAYQLMHPKHEVQKVYHVWVERYTQESVETLKQPIELDGYVIKQPRIRLLKDNDGSALLEVTIHEGRNRQIRRMCQNAGLTVTRLRRVAEGSLSLGTLKIGTWRHLLQQEIEDLRK